MLARFHPEKSGPTNKQQAGLTLVELLVSISLLVLIGSYFVAQRIEAVKMQRAEGIAQEIMTLAGIATAFHINTQTWPDQNGNCVDLFDALQAEGVFPAGYTPFSESLLEADCRDSTTSPFGRILRLTLRFAYADRDQASLVATMLPASSLTIPATTASHAAPDVTVEHYLFPPRKHTVPPFQLVALGSNSRLRLDKPRCAPGATARVMLIPQSICIVSSTGLGGFVFQRLSAPHHNYWEYELRVRGGNSADFNPMGNHCGGHPVEIGAVTYCEN